jgi:F-type H+-transporting ATPase subunit b
MISINYNLIIEIAIFLVMMYILTRYLIRPILNVIDSRDEKINSTRNEAQYLKKDAEAKIQEYEARLEDARAEANRERERIKKSAYSEQEDMLKNARTEAADMIADLRENIARQYSEASQKLRQESEELSRIIAERILGRVL